MVGEASRRQCAFAGFCHGSGRFLKTRPHIGSPSRQCLPNLLMPGLVSSPFELVRCSLELTVEAKDVKDESEETCFDHLLPAFQAFACPALPSFAPDLAQRFETGSLR